MLVVSEFLVGVGHGHRDQSGVRSSAVGRPGPGRADGLFAGQHPRSADARSIPRWCRCFTRRIAMLLFLRLDVHHWLLRAVAQQLSLSAAGHGAHQQRAFTTAIAAGGRRSCSELGVQIAAPVLAATLVADLVLGLLGKASPQMPVMLLGPGGQEHARPAAAGRGARATGRDLFERLFLAVALADANNCCIWRVEHSMADQTRPNKRHRGGGKRRASRARLRARAN